MRNWNVKYLNYIDAQMDYSTILSSANKLKKASLYKITIAESTKELLYRINTAILNAHDAGLTAAEVKLPINFKQIDNNVTNKELQISIYYNIVTELERMGYDVKLKFTKEYTLLTVTWVVKAEESALEEMHNKLLQLSG